MIFPQQWPWLGYICQALNDPNGLGIWLPVLQSPSRIVTTNPSGTGLDRSNIVILMYSNIAQAIDVASVYGLSSFDVWNTSPKQYFFS